MKKINFKLFGRSALALLIAFSCIQVFLQAQSIHATEAFSMREEVVYADDKQSAVINFDSQSIDSEYQIVDVVDPEGISLDTNNLTYSALKNETYLFTIKYIEKNKSDNANNDVKTFIKEVLIDQLRSEKAPEQVEVKPIIPNPFSLVSNGGVSIELPEYNALVGFDNSDVLNMSVKVDFNNDNTSDGKKVVVTLPEGLKYVQIPVAGTYSTTGVDTSILATLQGTDPLATAIQTVELPAREASPMLNTFGQVTYTLDKGTKTATFDFKVRVDNKRFYKAMQLPNPISAQAYMGNPEVEIGNVNQDINVKGFVINTGDLGMYTSSGTSSELLASTTSEKSYGYGYTNQLRLGMNGSPLDVTSRYVKTVTYYAYYPQGMKYEGITNFSSGYALNDPTNSRVVVTVPVWSTNATYRVTYSVPEGTAAGTYANPTKDYAEVEYFDGTKETKTYTGSLYSVKVVNTAVNKVDLIYGGASYYDDSVSNDHNKYGPFFRVENNKTAGTKTNQVVHFKFGAEWHPRSVRLPFDTGVSGNVIKDIEYKTNKKTSWTAHTITSPNQLATTGNLKIFSAQVVGLDDDEYFTEVRANMGSFRVGYASGSAASARSESNVTSYGQLATGATEASVVMTMYDANDKATTEVSQTGKIINSGPLTKTTTTNSSANFHNKAGNAISQILAGQTFEIRATIGVHTYQYGNTTAVQAPEIYLRQPEGMTIAIDTLVVKDNEGTILTDWTYDTHINSLGETIYKIKTSNTTIIGNFFGDKATGKTLNISYDVNTSVKTVGNYDARDLIGWGKAGLVPVPDCGAATWPRVDIYDFNGNGNTSENVLTTSSRSMSIIENKNVLVETFLSLAGEAPKDPYVEGNESSVAFFTPGTDADYSVKVTNNGDGPANTFDAFIPISKTGSNFGPLFQSEAFKWDMTLSSAVVNTPGFQVLYSTDATAANYNTTANYNSTPPSNLANVKMIKLHATSPIAPADEVVFNIPLKVDETFASATLGNKISTRNIYNPAYDVVSDTFSGTLSATKVGTELVIAEIGGIVFEDKNGDGLYKASDGDILIKDHEVELYKYNDVLDDYEPVLDASNQPIKTKTNSSGVYNFDYTAGMGYGNYAVRFVEKTGANYEYTVHNTSDRTINSSAIISGPRRGWVLDIDPTKPIAKSIGCGFLKYNPPVDLGVSVNTTPSSVKVGNTINVGKTITPDFWNSIKDPTIPYTWEIVGSASEKAKASLATNSDGSVTITPAALASGTTTFQLQLTIKDVYGNTKTSSAVTISVISNTPPTISAPTATVYVGDGVDLLSGVSAQDNAGNNITLNTLPGMLQNTTITHSIPVASNAYTTAGTYEVTYTVKDATNNETTVTRIVKVNALPTISASAQSYEVESSNIVASVSGNASGSYLKASDTAGQAPTATALTPTDTIVSGPSSDFTKVGLYKVEYRVSTPEGKQAKKIVDVYITPKGLISENDISLGANNITLENTEATTLTEASAKKKANAIAVKAEKTSGVITGYTDITNKVVVNTTQLNAIKAAPVTGGIYDLTFSVQEGSTTLTKIIKVVVKGSNTPEPNALAITAKNINLTHAQALALSEADAKSRMK